MLVKFKRETRKHTIFSSCKKNIEIYYYEEEKDKFCVYFVANHKTEKLASFTRPYPALKMCQWLSGRILSGKEEVAKDEFLKFSKDNGFQKLLINE